MAIQEFSSGPQNYFEPGYFNGDYTETNVSKAGLVCEPDYVVGFEVSFGLYFVEGYLDEIYFYDNTSVFTVSAQCTATKLFAVSATGYYEQDYFVDDYFQSRGISTDLGCVATRIANSSVNLASVWSQSATASGITKQSSVSLSTAVAQTTAASKTVNASAAFVAAFAPTLTASALKNQTAIVASVITMSTAASVTRSTNVLLEHIADLNAMAAMSVGLSASLSISATQTTSAVSIPGILITTSSTATLSCAASRIQPVSATISAVSGLTTSRYFGSSRPRNLSAEGDGFDFNNYFSGNQLNTSALAGSEFIQFASNYGSIVPKANQSWVFSFEYSSLGTTRANGFLAVSFLTSSDNNTFANVRTIDSTGTSWRLDLFKTGQATVSQTFTAGSALTKIAVAYENGYVGIFVDNTRVALINLSSVTAVNWQRFNELAKPRFSLARNVVFDEFHFATGTRLEYNPQSSSVSATGTQTNLPATTQALYHFTGNGLDDIAVTESAQSALASAFTQQTINTGTFVPRSAQASLSSMATVVAQGGRPISATANLATASTLSVVIGSVKDSIALNAGAFTVTTQESRLRGVSSSITSAFAPTLNAQATRRGDITMSTVFAMSTTATSFTTATADIAAAFSVNCVSSVDFKAIGSLQSQANINVLGGKLKLFQADFTSALAFTVQAIGFEGTGVGLNTVSSLSVSARRLRTVVSAASSTFTQTTIGNNNPAPFEISDYEVFCSGWTFSAETAFSSNTPGSGQSLISVVIPKATNNPVNQVVGQISLVNGQGTDIIFAPVTYLYRVGTDLYQAYQFEKQHSYTTTNQTDSLSTDTFRSTGLSTSNINQSTGSFTISLDYDGIKGTQTSTGPIGSPITLRILGNPNYVMLMSSWYDNPPANTATLRNVSWEPSGQVFSIPYPLGTSADFRNVTSLTAEAAEVVIPNPAVFSTQAQIAVVSNGSFLGNATLVSAFSTAINAGKNVTIASNLASQSTITVTAVKVTRAGADLNVAAAQSTANDRLRTSTVALASAVSATITAVKRTGVVVNADTAVSQTVTGFRIKQGQASISALYSQLSVAFQNASGTVLLETVTAMQVTAEKNAVGLIAMVAAFTQSTNTANSKTARVSSAVAAQATLTADALRIQPAGANLSAAVTQTTNSDLSKITRVNAALATAATTVVTATRTRSTPSTLSAVTSIVCNNIVLREANANLVDSFDVLCSVQYIIRITATFSAFNSQLTVGEIINIDPALQLKIEAETRINKIPQETRVLSIESETRVNIIEDKT